MITPVPKKSCVDQISEHRPVSNLNAIAKIFEGVLYSKISPFIFSNIEEKQHGFCKGRSTVTNLAEFSDDVARCMQDGEQVDVIYTDVEKCFDRLTHNAILCKLKNIGISSSLIELFSSYLKVRKTFVRYENNTSDPFSPPSGIAQGSKLSSLLFILTYNDIHNHVQYSKYILYADDLKIYKSVKTEQDCRDLQTDLDSLNTWLDTIGLNFHPNKCLKMTYSNKKTKLNYSYKIKDTVIQSTETQTTLDLLVEQVPTVFKVSHPKLLNTC